MIDQKNRFENTPLHLAAYTGCLDICSLLLEREADVDSTNYSGNTPIQMASNKGHKDVVQLLLQYNAAVDTFNHYRTTSLHLASNNGHTGVVSLLLEHMETIEYVDTDGSTPLHLACDKGHAQVAELLLNNGANLDCLSNRHHTPLWYASRSGYVNVMTLLVARGADINFADLDGQTPLYMACSNQHPGAIEFLIDQGADFNKPNLSGRSALYEAWCTSDIEPVRPLIQTKFGILRTDLNGNSALHHFCLQGNTRTVEKLLQDERIDPSVQNHAGNTPLGLAAMREDIQIILCVLGSQHYYPDHPIGFQPRRSQGDHISLISESLQSIVSKRSCSKDELSPVLYWAIANNSPGLIEDCLQHFPEDPPLLKRRMTCLHVAAQYGHHELITGVFSQFNPAQTMDDGTSALHVAAANGHPGVTIALLDMMKTRSNERLKAIIQLNDANECPLSLAVNGRHYLTKDVLWGEIEEFIDQRKDCRKANAQDVGRIIELCAQLERPGNERLLLRILQEWFPHPGTSTESWTVLHFAAYFGQAVALWWLLSHGAHLKSDEIDLAHRILERKKDRVSRIIDDLLNNPPQIVEHTAITDDDLVPVFPQQPKDMEEELLKLPVAIIDFYDSQKTIDLHYTRRKVDEIIYDSSRGPNKVMEEARKNDRRQLGLLKNELQTLITSPAGVEPAKTERDNQDSNDVERTSDDKPDLRDLQFRWIHLPANHMKLMDDLLTVLSIESNRTEKDHRSFVNFFDRSWIQVAAGGGKKYMKAQCIEQQPGDTPAELPSLSRMEDPKLALYMPYVVLGEILSQSTSEQTSKSGSKQPQDQSANSKSRLFEQVVHQPLTLDQFFYPTIEDTTRRDESQVISRYLNSPAGKEEAKPPAMKPEKLKVLFIDQLWLWVVDEKTIMTTTTKPSGQSEDILSARIREFLMSGENKGRFERPKSVQDMVQIILSISTGFFAERTIPTTSEDNVEERKSPLEIFRLSIRKVADKEAKLFDGFMKSLEREFQTLKDGTKKSEDLDSEHHHETFIRDMPKNPYHIIDQEAYLLDEIKDIRDEINMLRALAEAQENVWKQAFKDTNELNLSASPTWNNICTPKQVLQELKEMKVEAEMIHDAINTLLDLRQKQATIKEAEFGRRQANDMGKQANIILVFTIVTILFLPLSFLSSLFALDVSDFPHQSGDLKYQGWWIFPIIFGVSACVSVPFIYAAFNVNRIVRFWEQIERSWCEPRRKSDSQSSQPTTEFSGNHRPKSQLEREHGHVREHQQGQEPEMNARSLHSLARMLRGSHKEEESNSTLV